MPQGAVPQHISNARTGVHRPRNRNRRTTWQTTAAAVLDGSWRGLGIGALVGVLYAPKSGRETRDDLAAQAQDAKEKAGAYVDQGRDQLNQYVATSKDQINDAVDKGRDYYEKGRTQWSQYVDKGKDFLAEQQTKVAGAVDAGKQAYQQETEQQS